MGRATLRYQGQRSEPTGGLRRSVSIVPHRDMCRFPVGSVCLLLRPLRVHSTYHGAGLGTSTSQVEKCNYNTDISLPLDQTFPDTFLVP